jgi:hypothetical protein
VAVPLVAWSGERVDTFVFAAVLLAALVPCVHRVETVGRSVYLVRSDHMGLEGDNCDARGRSACLHWSINARSSMNVGDTLLFAFADSGAVTMSTSSVSLPFISGGSSKGSSGFVLLASSVLVPDSVVGSIALWSPLGSCGLASWSSGSP